MGRNAVSAKDEKNFNYSWDKVVCILKDSEYKNNYLEVKTFLTQGDIRWNKRCCFEDSLANQGIKYFAYIKFYKAKNNKSYALVAGKTGSNLVNCRTDLLFSKNPDHGKSRRWLKENNLEWDTEKIIIVYPDKKIENKKANENDAFAIESFLQTKFDLFST